MWLWRLFCSLHSILLMQALCRPCRAVHRWPQAAEEYKVSLVSVNGELPTLLLFERGKVTQRLLTPYGSALKGGLSLDECERQLKLSRF